jgi:hypothetical protein
MLWDIIHVYVFFLFFYMRLTLKNIVIFVIWYNAWGYYICLFFLVFYMRLTLKNIVIFVTNVIVTQLQKNANTNSVFLWNVKPSYYFIWHF